MTLQTLISGGLISALLVFLGTIAVAVLNRAKTKADATNSIADGAKIVVDMVNAELERKDAKLERTDSDRRTWRDYARMLVALLESHGIAVPPVPPLRRMDDE